MSNQYTRIESPFPGDWQPAYVSLGLEQALRAVSKITALPVYIGQPPYNTGNPGSKGTHNKRNCADLYGRKGHVESDLNQWQKWLRLCGWPGWVRNPGQGAWPWHLHFLKHGDPGLASLALDQDDAYVAGYSGLGYLGRASRDYGFRPVDPRITHVYKRTDFFEVRLPTHSYSQPTKHEGLQKKAREKGFVIRNHVLTVADHAGKQFILTDNGSFYDRQKLKAIR